MLEKISRTGSGSAAVEYALISGAIAVALSSYLSDYGMQMKDLFQAFANNLPA